MFSYHQITLKKFEEKITIVGDKTSWSVRDTSLQLISLVLCIFVFNLLNQ